MDPPVAKRMAEIESRLAFQEDLIENLDQVVARQDRELLALKQQLADLAGRLRELHEAAMATAPSSGTEVPPHY